MFFESWWQGLVFGIATTVAMLSIGWAFSLKWKEYEGPSRPREQSCEIHH